MSGSAQNGGRGGGEAHDEDAAERVVTVVHLTGVLTLVHVTDR